jgi:hypothetical protein
MFVSHENNAQSKRSCAIHSERSAAADSNRIDRKLDLPACTGAQIVSARQNWSCRDSIPRRIRHINNTLQYVAVPISRNHATNCVRAIAGVFAVQQKDKLPG